MAEYETLGFYEHRKLIRERDSVLPDDVRKEVRKLLGRLIGLRGDRNAGVHSVWSQFGFGWRNDPDTVEGEPVRLRTFKVDQATIEAKVLKAALLVEQLIDLQDRCNRLQVERYYKRMSQST